MKTRTTFIADDGTEFVSELVCRNYELNRKKKHDAIMSGIKALDERGKELDLSMPHWFAKAMTLDIKTGEACLAFGELLCDGTESFYDCYDPDLGSALLTAPNPRIMVYINNPPKVNGYNLCSNCWVDASHLLASFPNAAYVIDRLR